MNITIYTTKTCMYCNLAKNLLIEKKIDFKEINIENDLTIFNELIKKTKSKTVPQIFINEKFIGGYTELNELLKTNKI
ncbi:MAG TPA: glutaredoxin domain-containing protein [Candidatus Azoamicus sp.]